MFEILSDAYFLFGIFSGVLSSIILILLYNILINPEKKAKQYINNQQQENQRQLYNWQEKINEITNNYNKRLDNILNNFEMALSQIDTQMKSIERLKNRNDELYRENQNIYKKLRKARQKEKQLKEQTNDNI